MAELDFNVEAFKPVVRHGPDAITQRDLMSPYVWKGKDGSYQMMVRAVPRMGDEGDTGTIWYATSEDGLTFTATDKPVIAPGPGSEDVGGCEEFFLARAGEGWVLEHAVCAGGGARLGLVS